MTGFWKIHLISVERFDCMHSKQSRDLVALSPFGNTKRRYEQDRARGIAGNRWRFVLVIEA